MTLRLRAAVAVLACTALMAPAVAVAAQSGHGDPWVAGMERVQGEEPGAASGRTDVTGAAAAYPWRTASITDATGDATNGGGASADLAGASVRYNPLTGAVRWTIKTAGAINTSAAAYFAVVGTWDGNFCTSKVQLARAGSDTGWATTSANGPATASISGSTLTLSATDSRLRNASINCGFVQTASMAATPTVHDSAGAVSLAIPAKPKPKPKPKPRLAVSVPKAKKLKRGGSTKVRVRIKNTGNGPTKKVVLRAKGSKVKPRKASLGKIGAGKTRAKVVRVRLVGKKSKVRFTVKTAGLKAVTKTTTLRLKKKRKPLPPASKGLAGKYFWRFETSLTEGWDNRGLLFVDRKWAYRGFPAKGIPKCRKVTAKGSGDGCLRYTFNKKNGKLKVGGQKGTYKKGKLRLAKNPYWPLAWAKKGARYNLKLVHKDFNGCGVMPYCTTWTDYLRMDKKGRFVLARTSISSIGFPGGSQSWFSSAGPDERGRYQIKGNGRIVLKFANGKKRNETFAIQTTNKGKPAAKKEGVMIGETNFYPSS